MFENNSSRHRDGSLRAQWWDYRDNAFYFVTICLKPRLFHFGSIRNGVVCLSDAGSIAYGLWEALPTHFPNVLLGQFIIMPDHMHGILSIENSPWPSGENRPKLIGATPNSQHMSDISPQKGSLGAIIRSYKAAAAKAWRANNIECRWQPLYYERIIRNQEEYIRFSEYIISNPTRWTK